jgi:hypothetical protein
MRLIRRLLLSVLAVLLIVVSYQASAAAAAPRYLICQLGGGFGEWFIVIENFGGLHGAVQHCVVDLNGHPTGVE